MDTLAQHHQIHGIQPVLPVPDVAAAADWFVRTLGFELDFLHGDPVVHGRVKLGDHSWGAPIYIHLSRSDAPIQPCGETRLHVGHDIDGLHAHAVVSGAAVLLPPTNQPWGLREMVLQGPAGHRLVLGAEIEHQPGHALPRPVIACYKPKAGQEAVLLDLVRRHVPELRRLGLATERAPMSMRAADGTLVEVFEWASAQAIADAHEHPEVHKMWAAFGAACEYVKLSQLAEAQQLFAEFTLLD
jgi:catechol 2,3-dioxygenase-like lactoylglutathione lyase family enzyme